MFSQEIRRFRLNFGRECPVVSAAARCVELRGNRKGDTQAAETGLQSGRSFSSKTLNLFESEKKYDSDRRRLILKHFRAKDCLLRSSECCNSYFCSTETCLFAWLNAFLRCLRSLRYTALSDQGFRETFPQDYQKFHRNLL